MNTQFHTPSFGDEIFDLGDGSTSTPSSSGFLGGNSVNNLNTTSHWYQQQQQNQQTPPSTKRMISLHNTSDEYHTANEESFNITANNSMNQSTVVQQNTNNNVLSGVGITPTATATGPPTTMAARKQMLPLNQNEPAKPLSAYALFFRDTVSAIKQQNPNCTFQELSKIVASMWEALDAVHKGVYNKKHEAARTEYLKQLKIYQQQQQLKQHELLANNNETLQTETTNSLTQVQQVAAQQPVVANNQQQNKITTPSINTATHNTANVAVAAAAAAPTDEQFNLLTEASTVQKCTRENCNKRAIINPDWEDEYCSNECVVIHCRNVFSAWVQSNLEAKQQQQQQQQQTTVNQQTTAAT